MLSASAPSRVPALLGERLGRTFADFVAAVELAAQSAPHRPGFSANAALKCLETRALPVLRVRLSEVQSALAVYMTGDFEPLVAAARTAQTLARDLDGFDLNINGTGNLVREQLTYVVMAAYQIVTAADGS